MYFWAEHWLEQSEVSRAYPLEIYNEEADSWLTLSFREAIWWRLPLALSDGMVCRDGIFWIPSLIILLFLWFLFDVSVCLFACLCARTWRSFLATAASNASPLPPFLCPSYSLFPSPSLPLHKLPPPPPFLLSLHSFLFHFLSSLLLLFTLKALGLCLDSVL